MAKKLNLRKSKLNLRKSKLTFVQANWQAMGMAQVQNVLEVLNMRG